MTVARMQLLNALECVVCAVLVCQVNKHFPVIYTTKIDWVVCPPNISETVAGRHMKLAHRQRIASTTIKLSSKKVLLSILAILVKTIQRIVADPGSGKTIQPIRM